MITDAILLLVLVIFIATVLCLTTARKFAGASEQKIITAPKIMLFNGMGNFNYWLVQNKLAESGFTNLDHPDVVNGVLVEDTQVTLPPVDYLRLDVQRYAPMPFINYDLLRIKTRVINQFAKESKTAIVHKHKFHQHMRGKKFYPPAINFDEVGQNLDRIWILRPSLNRFVRGIVPFWNFRDVFIVYDAESLAKAQARYAELNSLAPPENQLQISVTEYIKPALIDGYKPTIVMYMMISICGGKMKCSINRNNGFMYTAIEKYTHGDFENIKVHHPWFDRRNLKRFYPAEFPAEFKTAIGSALDEIEIEICRLGQNLKCPANADAAYEIFSMDIILGEDNQVYLIDIPQRTGFALRDLNLKKSCAFQEEIASWEASRVLDIFKQIDGPE